MSDVRSGNCVFVSHCILAQFAMADGLVKKYPAMMVPVVRFCMDNNINIIQMPCPETMCASGGVGRSPHGKAWYEKHGLREVARDIARRQVSYIEELQAKGKHVVAIIGVEFSPACAVNFLNKGPAIIRDQGILIEEIKSILDEKDLDIKIIGISQKAHLKMEKILLDLRNDMVLGGLL